MSLIIKIKQLKQLSETMKACKIHGALHEKWAKWAYETLEALHASSDEIEESVLHTYQEAIKEYALISSGMPPLVWSAFQASFEITQDLLTSGASPNFCTEHGAYPIYAAAGLKDPKILNLFLDHPQTDVIAVSAKILLCAVSGNSVECLDRILKIEGLDVNGEKPENALRHAVTQGKTDMVKVLKKVKNINPNICDTYGTPILHIAVALNNIPMLKELLSFPNIDVNQQYQGKQEIAKGDTALEIAKRTRHTEQLEILLNTPGIRTLETLPAEILLKISGYLDPMARTHLSMTSKTMLSYCKHRSAIEKYVTEDSGHLEDKALYNQYLTISLRNHLRNRLDKFREIKRFLYPEILGHRNVFWHYPPGSSYEECQAAWNKKAEWMLNAQINLQVLSLSELKIANQQFEDCFRYMASTLHIPAIEKKIQEEGVKPPRLLSEIKVLGEMIQREKIDKLSPIHFKPVF